MICYSYCRYEMLRSCWDESALNRPSFKALKEAFGELSTRQAFHTPSLTLELSQGSPYYRLVSSSRRSRLTSNPEEHASASTLASVEVGLVVREERGEVVVVMDQEQLETEGCVAGNDLDTGKLKVKISAGPSMAIFHAKLPNGQAFLTI